MPEEKKIPIFVYGSLRKGEYNYKAFEDQVEHVKTAEITGYKMFSLGAFPYIVEEGVDSITVDLLHVTPTAKKAIDRMEFGAGYVERKINVDGVEGSLYVYDRPNNTNTVVKDGDWIKHRTK